MSKMVFPASNLGRPANRAIWPPWHWSCFCKTRTPSFRGQLQPDLPPESSQYSTLRPTRLDKIKNFHDVLPARLVEGCDNKPSHEGQLNNLSNAALTLAASIILFLSVACEQEAAEIVATAEPTLATTTATRTSEIEESTPTAMPQAQTFSVGDTVRLGDLHITVNGVSGDSGDSLWTPNEGHYFLYVDVTFLNQGNKSEVVSTLLQMKLRDADGFSYPVDLTAAAAGDKPAPDGEIAPGGILRGVVAYQVPVGATGLTWSFSGDLLRLGQAAFALGAIDVSAPSPELTQTLQPTVVPTTAPAPTVTPRPESTTERSAAGTSTPEPAPTPIPTATPTPEPTPVAIGTTVEVGGSSYTLNEIVDPAPVGIFGVSEGRRLVALDVTQVGAGADSDSYNPLYFAVQDVEGYVYTPDLASADVAPLFGSGELASGQIVRGWVVFELPESAELIAVPVEPGVIGARTTIADFTGGHSGNLVSQTTPPVPTPPSSPVNIGTMVEVGGSSYTLNEIVDPAPVGIFGVSEGRRLVALDVTQVGAGADSDSYNPLYFAVQDVEGYVYTPDLASADVAPLFGSGELASGQIVRGWVVFELPESAELIAVLVEPGVFGARTTIADLVQGE